MELTPAEDKLFSRKLDGLGEVSFYAVMGNHKVETLGFVRKPDSQHRVEDFKQDFLKTAGVNLAPLQEEVAYSKDLEVAEHEAARALPAARQRAPTEPQHHLVPFWGAGPPLDRGCPTLRAFCEGWEFSDNCGTAWSQTFEQRRQFVAMLLAVSSGLSYRVGRVYRRIVRTAFVIHS